jgi:hypothetical protein
MRTNVLEKARERGLEIEEKINNHFDELLKKEKRKAIGKEIKTVARQFQRRRKQTEANARKEIRDAKKWKRDITKEEKRRRKEQSRSLNWEGTEFPTPLNNIKKFEDNNNIGVNVFSADESLKVYPLRVSGKTDPIRLFLWKNHYSVIKDMSRLAGSQISKNEHKKCICDRCLNAFGSNELLEKHLELCSNNDYQRHEYPKPGSTTKFENYEKTQTIPFAIYADFECYIKELDVKEQKPDESSTIQYQKHNPSGFCYHVRCFDNSIYKPKLVHYTQQYEGEDITKTFVDMLEEETKDIYNKFKSKNPSE